MKRAERRHFYGKLARHINREVEESNTRYDQNKTRWGGRTKQQSEAYQESRKQQDIRHLHCNDARFVRMKMATGGRWHICGCSWCVSNWTYSSQREIARINDEGEDFFAMGCPPSWGHDWWEESGWDSERDEKEYYSISDEWNEWNEYIDYLRKYEGNYDFGTEQTFPSTCKMSEKISSKSELKKLYDESKWFIESSDMKLWILTRSCGWDEYDSFIVCASTEEKARQLAFQYETGEKKWLNPKKSTCERINLRTEKAGVLLGSSNAG